MQDENTIYARLAAEAAEDKKARNIVILDIRGLSMMADFFVICSANSRTQVKAVAEYVRDVLEEKGLKCKGIEGRDEAKWVLIDFGDVIVHVFMDDERAFFNIERLWGDAPRLTVSV